MKKWHCCSPWLFLSYDSVLHVVIVSDFALYLGASRVVGMPLRLALQSFRALRNFRPVWSGGGGGYKTILCNMTGQSRNSFGLHSLLPWAPFTPALYTYIMIWKSTQKLKVARWVQINRMKCCFWKAVKLQLQQKFGAFSAWITANIRRW